MSDERAYEVHGLRNGRQHLHRRGSRRAVARCRDGIGAAARRPLARAVKLYRVPFVHIGSAPWGEGQMHFICQVEPKSEGA
jgi:hypothetical protein